MKKRFASDGCRPKGYDGRRLPRTFSTLACVLLVSLITVYSGLARQFLPARFFLDQNVVLQYSHLDRECDFLLHRDSFACTELVYRAVGINEYVAPWMSGALIGFLYFCVPLLAYGRVSAGRPMLVTLPLAFAWACTAATFNGGLNKELLALVFICLASLCVVRGSHWLAILCLLCYAIGIRSYWVLMLCTALVVSVAASRYTPKTALLAAIACLVGIVALYYLTFGVSIGSLRQTINDARVNDVATGIVPFVQETSLVRTLLDMVLILFSLLLPFKLFVSGSVVHAAAAMLVAITVVFSWRTLSRASFVGNQSAIFAMSLVIGLLIVQCLFEPDYGSFMRHISDFIPFAILAERLVAKAEDNGAPDASSAMEAS